MKIFTIGIRNNKDINGIIINKEDFKISQLADDTTLYLAGISSLNIQNVDKHKLGISWQKGSFKMLGIWFSSTEYEVIRLNLNDKVERIKNIITAWSNIHLTIFGKIV